MNDISSCPACGGKFKRPQSETVRKVICPLCKTVVDLPELTHIQENVIPAVLSAGPQTMGIESERKRRTPPPVAIGKALKPKTASRSVWPILLGVAAALLFFCALSAGAAGLWLLGILAPGSGPFQRAAKKIANAAPDIKRPRKDQKVVAPEKPVFVKPVVEFDALPEVPSPLPIKPPPLEGGKKILQLPEPVLGKVVVGGGGRFLLLRLPKLKKAALFDINEARIVHHFPCPTGRRSRRATTKWLFLRTTSCSAGA